MKTLFLMIALIGTRLWGAAGIVESERTLPVAYDVDVVVVGGSTRAVAAAVAAKESGASVFLLAQRAYLGADMCSTYHLWRADDALPKTSLAKAIFKENPPTPMQIKRTLDEALLDAQVDFLFGCLPTDVLRDQEGRLAGVVMANRSGRQAIRAKVIIDATDRATLGRIAGAPFSAYLAGNQTFTRRVLGGEADDQAKALPFEIMVPSDSRRRREDKVYPLYQYSLSVEMKDASWRSFAEAEQTVRDATWREGQADASEGIFQVPPDPVMGRKSERGPWRGAAELDLDALRPKETEGLYILGGCADVSRLSAAEIMRPLSGIELGMRVGRAAAKEAGSRSVGSLEELTVAGSTGGEYAGEVKEMLSGVRHGSVSPAAARVKSPRRSIPLLATVDVVIVGGGTAGAPAGIAAARNGAKTLVIEWLDGLGGVGTLGRISKYYHGNRVGFTREVDSAVGGASWKPETKMEWFRQEIRKAGGEIWFHSLGCGAIVRDNCVVGVIVATPFGRGAVLANTVIDATGNAVIPACAGMPCQEITGEHIAVQGAGLPTFSPGVGYLNGDWTFIDDSDVVDVWRAFVVAKQKFKDRFTGFDLGQMPTTRARRRIMGDVVISPMDIVNKRTYPDVITVAKSNFDNHGFSSHQLFMITPPDRGGLVGNVPYRALMPRDYDGLLVTGLGISAHGDAMPVLRMQPDVQNQGYAAGLAAAMSAQDRTTVRGIDVKQLQQRLVTIGIIPETMLTATDSYPVSDDVMLASVVNLGTDTSAVSIILTDPERALPMVQDAWREASEPEAKLRYAHVLGMLGDATGADTLIDALKDATWDRGWSFRGMGQYGRTTSNIDNLVIALGRTRARRGLPVVLTLLEKLTVKSDFSHLRAVAIACETLRNPRAAKPLHALLMQEGMTGHAFTEIEKAIKETPSNPGDVSTRRRSLPELVLARALYRCGDEEGLGERILKSYANDLRGHYATHARKILDAR